MKAAPEIFDVEADTTTATDAQLSTIAGLLRQVPVLQQKVADAQAVLAAANFALTKLTDDMLPEALSSAGYDAPTKCVIAGQEVKFDTFLSTSITDEHKPAAFAWLRKNGHGDLIKRETKFVFPKGSDAFHKKFMAAWVKLSKGVKLQIKLTDKESVHGGTLKAFVKEEITQGNEVPADLFSVYVGKHVDVRPVAALPTI